MKKIQVPKPIKGEKTGITKAFEQFMKNTDLPINNWCLKNKK